VAATNGDPASAPLPATTTGRVYLDHHLGLLVGASIATLGILKLLALAKWETETAAAIFRYSGTTDIVVGTVVASANALIIPLLWIPLVVAAYLRARDGVWPAGLWWPLVLSFTTWIALFVGEIWMGLLMLGITGMGVIFGRMDRGNGTRAVLASKMALVSGLLANLGVVQFVFADDASWLPSESIRVDGETAFTGYILSGDASSEWIVLRDEPRRVEFVPAETDRERRPCRQGPDNWASRSLLNLLEGEESAYPECP
jgi:hypothetical protein